MPLNIPLPSAPGEMLLKGIQTGGNLFQQIMHPILERERLKQTAELEREKQQQLERHFQEQLGLSKAAAGRAAQAAMDAHKLNLQKMDPTRAAKEYEALENYFRSRGRPNNLTGQMAPEESSPIPTQEIGQGMGMLNPEALAQQPQEAPQTSQNNPFGVDLELMKQNPLLRGFFKKKFGVDPLAIAPQTPEEKNASQLQLFKQKEEYKAQQEQKLPAAVKTLHENIIQLSPKAHKAIQHLIDIPSPFEPWGMGAFYSGQKAAHRKAVLAAAENYAKAKGWPNTKGSIEKASEILERGNYETDYDYRERLKEYQKELDEGVEASNQFLHPNKSPKAKKEEESNVIEYVRGANGKLVPKKAKS